MRLKLQVSSDEQNWDTLNLRDCHEDGAPAALAELFKLKDGWYYTEFKNHSFRFVKELKDGTVTVLGHRSRTQPVPAEAVQASGDGERGDAAGIGLRPGSISGDEEYQEQA